jgi:hypothetical protein
MNIKELEKLIGDNLTFAVLVITSTPLIFKTFRTGLCNILRYLKNKIFRESIEFREKVLAKLETSTRDSARIEKIEYALYNNGHTGVLQHVGRLVARDSIEFEASNFPAFECDRAGNNLRVTSAYRKLVGVNRNENLKGGAWHQVIYGELKDSYIKEFERCSSVSEDFSHEIDLHNPITGEHRGRWLIYAPVSIIGNDLLYSGRFAVAIDHVARAITASEGWLIDIRKNINPDPIMSIMDNLNSFKTNNKVGVLYPVNSGGMSFRIPIETDEWTAIFPGIELKHVSDDVSGSNFLLQSKGGVILPPHSHPNHVKDMEVISGIMIDPESGIEYKPDDKLVIPQNKEYYSTVRSVTLAIRMTPKCEVIRPNRIMIEGLNLVK